MITLKNIFLIVFASLLLVSCTPSEETSNTSYKSQRAENIKKYSTNSKRIKDLTQQRSEPIAKSNLISQKEFRKYLSLPKDIDLGKIILQTHEEFEAFVKKSKIQQNEKEVLDIVDNFKNEFTTTSKNTLSNDQFSENLQNLVKKYSQEVDHILSNQKETPTIEHITDKQIQVAEANLKKTFSSIQKKIGGEYGSECATKTLKAFQDFTEKYLLILSSTKYDELQGAIKQFATSSSEEFKHILLKHGNWQLSLKEEDISSIKTCIIEAHQKIEKKFDALYGKDSVLKARAIFEKYFSTIEKALNSSLLKNDMWNTISISCYDYRKDINALQLQLNEDFNKKILNFENSELLRK